MFPCNSNNKSDRKQITFSANAEGYRLASITAREKEAFEGPVSASLSTTLAKQQDRHLL